MKKLEIIFLILFTIWTLLVIFGKAPLEVALTIYVPLIFLYLIAWLIRNSIEDKKQKQYNMAKIEKQRKYNNGIGLNTVLYTGMNGKQITLWKFILGVILLVGGIFGAISTAINLGIHWKG